MSKKTKANNIYEYLLEKLNCSKEDTDKLLLSLTDNDRELIRKHFSEENNHEISTRFCTTLMPKIKRRIFKMEQPTVKHEIKPKEETHVVVQTPEKIQKTDCELLLNFMNSSIFNEMVKTLSPKEAVIVSLKVGLIDGKTFTSSAIANFLEMNVSEVIDITRRVLQSYQEQLNILLSKAIEAIVTDERNNIR